MVNGANKKQGGRIKVGLRSFFANYSQPLYVAYFKELPLLFLLLPA